MWHLLLFTAMPKALPNSSRATLNFDAEERVAGPSNKVSSTNKAWFMFFTPLAIHSPLISWYCIFLSNRKLRIEAWMTNSRGDRGHPCLSPLEALKKSVALPFTNGAIHGSEMHARIHLMNFSPNPNLLITFNRKLWFTRSNALAKSSLIAIPFSLRRRLEWIASWMRMKLSTICLPWMKPPWFSGIILGRMSFNLFAIILVINLYPVLHREIRRNLLKMLAPFSLGIRAKKAEFVLPPIFWVFWDFCTILSKSFSIIGQQTWRNLAEKPSGLGALSGSISNRAFSTSSLVILASRVSFVCWDITEATTSSNLNFDSDPCPHYTSFESVKWLFSL